MKKLVGLIVGTWPASRLKNFTLSRLGHSIASSARVGPIVLLGSTSLSVGANCRVGPFNVFRNVQAHLSPFSELGQWNWISAAPFLVEASSSPIAGTYRLGVHSSMTSRHYVDASGGVDIQEFVTVAGVRSTFMSHGIDVKDNFLDTAPIAIGHHAMLGSNCNLVMGSRVPPHSVVAMGSVVVPGLDQDGSLFAGVPAKLKKRIDRTEYFLRTVGAVAPRPRS